MCQISVINLHDEDLNKMLFEIAGSFGSVIHDDGWGITSPKGTGMYKSAVPMFCALDSGETLRKAKTGDSILLGHIRAASPRVPVVRENSHPFEIDKIRFFHNGTLTPKVEKDFVTEVEVQSRDTKTGELETHKDGTPKMIKVKRSDSLVFFEKFMEIWKNTDVKNQDTKFVTVLKETMALFTGKFAMTFVIKETAYIVRGRTADLFITYWRESRDEKSAVRGWVVNTDAKTLDWSTNLMSNLHQLLGGELLWFDSPHLIEQESIYKAGDFGLEKIGEIKEETTTTGYTPFRRDWAAGAENFTGTGKNDSTTKTPTEAEKYFQEVYEFLIAHSLYPNDLQSIFSACYDASLTEVTASMLKHFCKEVLPELRKMTTKEIRKEVKKKLAGHAVSSIHYKTGVEYPWIFNTKAEQEKFAAGLEKIM